MGEAAESFRDSISTIGDQGQRVWINPKKPSGRYHQWRIVVTVLLLVFMVGVPFVKVNGQPLVLLNLVERKFILFGLTFWPQDFYIFALVFITGIIFIVLFTIIFGRIFCGWVCPQTIFMEMVFRKIEYLIEGDYTKQKKLNRQNWNTEKIVKKGSKHIIFFGLSFIISNIFLSYIIGVDELWEIITAPPSKHMMGFLAMIGFSGAFYWVFAWFREQVCIIACPYGRLQGVMLDQNSLVVAYDDVRGEPREKLRKAEERAAGDCINCKQCVHVCPTGIDIRNGTQLECVNCTACIDACDDIMDRIEKPRGLIGFYSEKNIKERSHFRFFTPRIISYSFLLLGLLVLTTSLITLRSDVDVTLLRERGTLYQKTSDGLIRNVFKLSVVNKTIKEMPIEFKLEGVKGVLSLAGGEVTVPSQGMEDRLLLIDIAPKDLTKISQKIEVGVYSNGELVAKESTKFLTPYIE